MDKAIRLDVSGNLRATAPARRRRGATHADRGGEMLQRRRPMSPQADAQARLSRGVLQRENSEFRGSGGVSAENGSHGFAPAFFDTQTCTAYRSRFANGEPAPCHILDGLPDEIVLARSVCGRVDAVRPGVVSGFLYRGRFYSREQAAQKVAELG